MVPVQCIIYDTQIYIWEKKLVFHYTYFRAILRTYYLVLTAQINPIELRLCSSRMAL